MTKLSEIVADLLSNPKADLVDGKVPNTQKPFSFGILAERPEEGEIAGDSYIATNTHEQFMWDGESWIKTENFTQTEHDVLTHSASLLEVESPAGKYLKDDGTWGTLTGGRGSGNGYFPQGW